MRHGKRFNHLGRTASHRKAMLSNMAGSLIESKRITTTVAKAKALRKYIEPLLTKAKTDSTHSRRVVFSYLQNKYAIQTLFDEIATKIADRPGGYTRIIRTGNRLGDNAEMCLIELVDYNTLLLPDDKESTSKTRRSRRGKGKADDKTDSGKGEVAAKGKKATTEKKATKATSEEVVVEEAEVIEETAQAETEITASAEEAVEAVKAEDSTGEQADSSEDLSEGEKTDDKKDS